MSYVLKSNHRSNRSPLPLPLKIVAGLVAVLFILYVFFPNVLPYLFTTLVKPFWNLEQNAVYGSTSITELRAEYEQEISDSAKQSALQLENDDLKSLLGRSLTPHPLLATILKKPPFTAYDTFIIDVGVNDHIVKGDKVYAPGNIPIGEIAEVVGGTSRVLLYSSAGEKFTVSIGTSNIQATAEGKGGGYFETSLPRDAKVAIGDQVLIPSLTNSFAGTIQATTSDPSEPFSKVLFRQPINIYELRFVVVDPNTVIDTTNVKK